MSADMVEPENYYTGKHSSMQLNLKEKLKNLILESFQPGQRFLDEGEISEKYKTGLLKARRLHQALIREGFLKRGKGLSVEIPPEIIDIRNRFIGIFISEPIKHAIWSIYHRIISAIKAKYQPLNIQLIHSNIDYNFQKALEQSKTLLNRNVDGIIFHCISSEYDYSKNKKLIEIFERNKVPVVLIDKYFLNEPENYSYVVSNNEAGGYMATQHLLNLGYQRIAFIRDVFSSSVYQRELGYRKALFQAGFRVNESQIKVFEDHPQLIAKLDELFKKSHPPEAVIAINDWIASEIYAYLARTGLRIPHDIAVVGFDDLPNAAQLKPPLTTVRQDFIRMGEIACRFMLQRMKNFEQLPNLKLPCELIVRESCGVKFGKKRAHLLASKGPKPPPSTTSNLPKKSHPILKSRATKTKAIGLLYPGFPNNSELENDYKRVIQGLEEVARSHKLKTILTPPFTGKLGEYDAIKYLLRQQIKGFIFIATHDRLPPSQEELVFLFRRRIPFLLLSHCDLAEIPCVTINDRQGGAIAAEHLVKTGRHQIAGLLTNDIAGERRLRGILDVLSKQIDTPHDFVEIRDIYNDQMTHFDAAYQWAKQHVPSQFSFNGFICHDTTTASGLIKGLNENGLTTPDDVAVIGFGDKEMEKNGYPQLTLVQMPYKDWGRQAMEEVTRKIFEIEKTKNKSEISPMLTTKLSISPSLLIRSTT